MLCIFAVSAQNYSNSKDFKYYDEDQNQISKVLFKKKMKTKKYFAISGEDYNLKVLIKRKNSGMIEDYSAMLDTLNTGLEIRLDRSKLLTIIYYPGKDGCNSSGTATKGSYRTHYNRMEKGIAKIHKNQILFIYKDSTGLGDRVVGGKTWYPDTEKIFERRFFRHPYPCGSFVMIHPSGNFISYFGEYSSQGVITAAEELCED